MPKKNNSPNGFFMFMRDERKRIQAETKQKRTMQEMAALCSETWKDLSAAERARYDALAKQEKGKPKTDQGMRQRMDNKGQVIAVRKTTEVEVNKRKTRENQDLLKCWEGQDVRDIKFHLINFQVMYTEEPVNFFLPMEIGMVCFTLRDGIVKHFHQFIDPGDAPQGSRHLALRHGESTHRIPLKFKEAGNNFVALWAHIQNFLVTDPNREEIPPLFCLSDERKYVESGLEFIYHHARIGEPNRLRKIYALEDLVVSLMLQSELVNRNPSESQVKDSLLRNQWDYIGSIRCSYHDEIDCSFCSLAIVKRLSFSIFDMLSKLLDFQLTESHVPEVKFSKFVVTYPTSSTGTNERSVRHVQQGNHRTATSISSSSPPSRAPSSQSMLQSHLHGSARVHDLEDRQSDSEDDDDDVHKGEIRSSDQYSLKELRKPQVPPMIMSHPVPGAGLGYGRGLAVAGDKAFYSGAEQSQLRYPRPVMPPPGFGSRPGVTSGAMCTPTEQPRPGFTTPQTQTALVQPANLTTQGFGRGVGRGRGMPPQIRLSQPQQNR